MITSTCTRFGRAQDNHFWIVCSSEKECLKELKQYAKKHPGQTIWYHNCGTRPGIPIPIPETTFEIYTPTIPTGLIIGWKRFS